jgi:hypothetical protein
VIERDDVGGRRIVEKFPVNVRDRSVIDEGNLDFIEIVENGGMRSGMLHDHRQRIGSRAEEAVHVERERGLVIVEFQRRQHCRKACFRGGPLQA